MSHGYWLQILEMTVLKEGIHTVLYSFHVCNKELYISTAVFHQWLFVRSNR